MNVFIVDAIGIHSGMKYYIDVFQNILKNECGVNVSVLSNFNEAGKPFFYNFYIGSKFERLYCLLIGLFRLLYITISNRNSLFFLLSYGTFVDALFILFSSFAKNRVLDVHEVIVQGSEKKVCHNLIFRHLFKNIKNVIIHSERSRILLRKLNYRGEFIFVPHFQYQIDEIYNVDKINNSVKRCIKTDRIGLLFFGNITYSKGIDLLINSVKTLPQSVKERLNIIIAGKTLDDTFSNCIVKDDVFSINIQHLNDDEMKFLYLMSDYVFLPYRQTSQSGVLEMAFHYKKPVIVSNIPYFTMMLNKFPSFGIITDIDEFSMHQVLRNIAYENYSNFYKSDDLNNYNNSHEIKTIVKFVNNYFNTYGKD